MAWPDWVWHLGSAIAAGVAVYAGIRADLAALRVKAEHAAQSADAAHRRIDEWTMQGGMGGRHHR